MFFTSSYCIYILYIYNVRRRRFNALLRPQLTHIFIKYNASLVLACVTVSCLETSQIVVVEPWTQLMSTWIQLMSKQPQIENCAIYQCVILHHNLQNLCDNICSLVLIFAFYRCKVAVPDGVTYEGLKVPTNKPAKVMQEYIVTVNVICETRKKQLEFTIP